MILGLKTIASRPSRSVVGRAQERALWADVLRASSAPTGLSLLTERRPDHLVAVVRVLTTAAHSLMKRTASGFHLPWRRRRDFLPPSWRCFCLRLISRWFGHDLRGVASRVGEAHAPVGQVAVTEGAF